MKISEICIQRPVLAWVMTLVLILLGAVGGYRLSLQQYPTFSRSFVTVETSLPGAGPEVVETQVSRIIEEALSGISSVENVTSISSAEDSKVTVEFNAERRIEDAMFDILERLRKNRDKLPHEATEPTLTKSRSDDSAIITIALTSDKMEPSELADFAKNELVKDLESLDGVARVDVLGAGDYTMRIYLDPLRLTAYGITVSEVLYAIKKQNIEKPAGKLIGKDREYAVTTIASLETPEEFDLLVVNTKSTPNKEKFLVKLMDIGKAEITADDRKTKTRYNGKAGVSIDVIKQSNANPIKLARAVKQLVEKIRPFLPEGVFINIGSDSTSFIERSVKEVYHTIFEATLLVIGVVFLFLRSARASIIPLITIPVSLIGVLFLMYLLNFSINILTLMAMVLAIGLVVDDAIVVLENIYSYIETGMKPFAAAVKGIREISFAVIAMTLTLVAVYIPITLAKGLTGKLLTEFAITLAGAVVISGFAALTISPMMCARMLGHREYKPDNLWYRIKNLIPTDRWLIIAENYYVEYLQKVVKNKIIVAVAAIIIALVGLTTYKFLPSMLFPKEDRGAIRLEGQAPQTATLGYTEQHVDKLDTILSKIPDIERRVVQINNPTFKGSIQLKENRSSSTDKIAEHIRSQMVPITGIEAKIDTGSSGGDGGQNKVEFVIRGNKTYNELKNMVANIVQDIHQSGKAQAVHTEIRGDTADFTVSVIRDKISSLNIEPDTIAETLDIIFRGRRANFFKKSNRMCEVRVEVENKSRQSPEDITNLFVKAGDKEGTLVPLSELVKVHSRSSPIEIHRHNRMRAIGVTLYLKPDVSVGEGVTLVDQLCKELRGTDYRMEYVDDTKRYLTEGKTIELVFFLAICFIYLVMAAQFESWRDPFIILLSVPLSLTGAVITLGIVDNGSINIYSNIGFITLIGLITKHGILMVDFANKLRQENHAETVESAIITACKLRLRPILMTTFAMILGALPLALASGAGSESRRQLGWVIVGGMSIGTLFTIFVVPAFYTIMSKTRKTI